MEGEQFSLCWNNFHSNLSSGFHSLLKDEDLVDVTLAAEGKYIKAHKTVLSVCSPFFKELFMVNPCKHPIVILPEVNYEALSSLMHFMYQGEVSVSQEEIPTFMRVAEMLKVKGLTDNNASPPRDTNGFPNSNRNCPDQRQNIMKRPRPIKKLIRPIQHLRPIESPKLSPSPQPSHPQPSNTPQPSHTPQPSQNPQPSHTPQPGNTPQPSHPPQLSHPSQLPHPPQLSHTPQPSPQLQRSHTPQPQQQLQPPQQQSPTLPQAPPTKKLHLENDLVQFPTSTTPQPSFQLKTENIHETLIKPKQEPLDNLDEDNTSHSGEDNNMDISHMLDTSLGEPSPSHPFPIWPSMDFPPAVPQDSSSPGLILLKSGRGQLVLIHNGHIYTLCDKKDFRSLWVCVKKKTLNCPGCLTTLNGPILLSYCGHNHRQMHDVIQKLQAPSCSISPLLKL